jgi:uncharacterized membrane protein
VDWLVFAIQWLHVFFGIFWFGSVLYVDFVLLPAISRLPIARQREVVVPVGSRSNNFLVPVAGTVIVLGFLRGTVFGQINSVDALTTPYGVTWLIALAAAVATFAWGLRVITPAVERMNAIALDQAAEADGTPSPRFAAAIGSLRRATLLELVGFSLIFTCMILMRFGF